MSVIGGVDLAVDDDGGNGDNVGGEDNQLESLEQFMMLAGGGGDSR